MALPQELPTDNYLTVKELSQQIKKRLEAGFQFIRVRGEVSGVTYHKSGHVYFALKGDDCVIDCVSWRGYAKSFAIPLSDGLEIVGRGSVTTYMGRSKYQFIMDSFEAAGRGALFTLLEQRKKLLQAEGLFDESLKLPIPRLPHRIGLITSSEGSVLHDITARLEERYIEDKVYLWPVTVQGENTPADIIAAINGFHKITPRPDVLIITRGGGSFEDLWQFNDEALARRIRASEIPIITAIGHEPDTPLIDYVSDRRASTPTNAAEIVAPKKEDAKQYLDRLETRMQHAFNRMLQFHQSTFQRYQATLQSPDSYLLPHLRKLDQIHLAQFLERFHSHKKLNLLSLSERCASPEATLKQHSWELQRHSENLTSHTQQSLETAQNKIEVINTRLEKSNFVNLLRRGFAIVHDENHQVINSTQQLNSPKSISIQLKDGLITGVFSPKP